MSSDSDEGESGDGMPCSWDRLRRHRARAQRPRSPRTDITPSNMTNEDRSSRIDTTPSNMTDELIVVGEESAIDLTSTVDEDYVDLTSSQRSFDSGETHGANDASVVILGSPELSPPAHRTRRSRNRREFPSDDSDVLVVTPPKVSRPSNDVTDTVLTSPEPIQISCPICLDDDKQIKRRKQKLISTKCGHIFCQPCVQDAIRSQGKCAVCRKKLQMSDVFVLHI